MKSVYTAMNVNQDEIKNNSGIITDNSSSTNNEGTLQEFRGLVMIYFFLLVCGGTINLVYAGVLIRCRRNGILSLILQLSLVDICIFYVATSEILTLNHKSWYFPEEHCPFFKGMEVLTNTLTIYLLVCFNFHVISLWNLCELEQKKNNKNPLTSYNSSREDSDECFVTRQENRLVTIDYRKRKEDISIVFPTIFIWIISLSLSVPNFTLSSTLKLKENVMLCSIIDVYYGQILQYSLLIFKIILPITFLFLSLIILIVKLKQSSKKDIDNVLTKKMYKIKRLLNLGIVLTVLYFLTSFQRQFLQFIHIISYPANRNTTNNYKIPPLYNIFLNTTSLMYLSMLHYSCSIFRGLLCLTIFPKFSHLITSKLLPCCKKKK